MSYTAPTVVASGTTFAQFQSGGASGHLELLIAAQAATLAPTVAATLSQTGSGGSLAGGDVLRGRHRVERIRRNDRRPGLDRPGDHGTARSRRHVPVAQERQRIAEHYLGTSSSRTVHARRERD